MKIVIVPDTLDWAIGHLAQAIVKYNPQHTFKLIPVHPRDAEELADSFEQKIREFSPDVIHFEYFRTAQQLLELKPMLKNYPIILTHHNQRDKALFHADWNKLGVDLLVTHTEKCRMKLSQKL